MNSPRFLCKEAVGGDCRPHRAAVVNPQVRAGCFLSWSAQTKAATKL